jgi:nucleoside-diphosphate-sugar epimerase
VKIAITGGNGFLGSNIVKKLTSEKHSVSLLSRDCEKVKEEISQNDPDILIHCGWHGGNCYQDINNPDQFLKNMDYSICLIESMKSINKKTKFIGFGSFAEYGYKDFIIDENTNELPVDLYGLSKYTFNKYSQLVCSQSNIDWMWIRPCYVYGANDVSTRLIPRIINKCINNENIILDECNKIVDYIHVDDFVEMFYRLLISSQTGIYNICSGKQYHLKDIISKIHLLTKSKSEITYSSELNRNMSSYICGNNQKVVKITNYNPKIDLETGLIKTINEI